MSDLVTPAFAPAAETFHAWAVEDPEYRGQLAVYQRGDLVLDISVGMDADALVPVFSSSKGAIGIVVAFLVERGQLDLDASVTSYWPEFAAAGKAQVTVRQLLSHQAGLSGVDGGFTNEELLAHGPLAQRLAAQRPLWGPGAGFAYHALTIGALADELVRRITGRTLGEVFRDDIAAPNQVDVHLGTPAELDHRVTTVDMPPPDRLAAYLATLPTPDPDALGAAAMARGKHLLEVVNDVDYRRVGPPAAGGLATARGLARMYAVLHHDLGQGRLVSDDTLAQVTQIQVSGRELANDQPFRFGVVFQRPIAPRWTFGSARAFGHDGAGGSLGYSDPAHDLTVGYVSKTLHIPVDLDAGPDPRMELSALIRRCAAAA